MAVAAYDSDLTSANSGLVDEALTVGNWDESSVSAWADGGSETAETNFYIQGTACISAQFTKTGVGTLINDVNQFAGTFTVDTDGAILIWGFWASPASLATYANGGVRTVIGNTLGDFYAFKASGSNFEPNPFGGWYNYAIDPNTATADTTVGTPNDTWSHVGLAINATEQSRGNPFAVDSIRVGRCTMEITEGQAGDYGTFTGMASFDDSSGQRYAVFQEVIGGYRWQGLMSLGLVGTSVDFRDSNANIVVANTPSVAANFNKIEIRNTSSNVEWTSISINAYGVNDLIAATNSAGKFEVVDNATVALTSCTFIDMDTFIFNSGTNSNTIIGTTFQKCGQVTQGAATFTGCVFTESTAAVALVVANTVSTVTSCDFTSDGTGYALEGFSTAASYDLTDLTYTTYAGINGITGNECIHVLATTGTVTLNISGGDTPTIHTEGATVTIVAGAVTVKAKAITSTGTEIQGAVILLKASDGTGAFPFEDSITITRSASTATASHTAHGMDTNDYVLIRGAEQQEYNLVAQITVIDVDSYSYTVSGTPTTPATGTITATFVALYGTTDINGEVSTSRVYSTAQPVTGYSRKNSSSPYYKQGSLSGTISTTTGFNSNAVMTDDE